LIEVREVEFEVEVKNEFARFFAFLLPDFALSTPSYHSEESPPEQVLVAPSCSRSAQRVPVRRFPAACIVPRHRPCFS
jgi:hypothetical protein